MDAYQATYDAVRSRVSQCDVGSAVDRAVREAFDISNYAYALHQEYLSAAYEMQRPSAIYRPVLTRDGNQWCALYGVNLVEGIAGFGDTAAAAMTAFDQAWWKETITLPTEATGITEARLGGTGQSRDHRDVIQNIQQGSSDE